MLFHPTRNHRRQCTSQRLLRSCHRHHLHTQQSADPCHSMKLHFQCERQPRIVQTSQKLSTAATTASDFLALASLAASAASPHCVQKASTRCENFQLLPMLSPFSACRATRGQHGCKLTRSQTRRLSQQNTSNVFVQKVLVDFGI